MALGDLIMSQVTGGAPFFPCGPCRSCFQIFGDTMEVTVTGVQLCGCFIDASGGPTRFWSPSNLVDVNGVYTINASSPGDPLNTAWLAVIGTIDIQEYDGTSAPPSPTCDGTPIGVPVTVDVTLTVECFQPQSAGLQASMQVFGSPIGGAAAQIFESTDHTPETYFQPGDVVPNVLTCSVNGLGYYIHIAAEGALTVTPP